MSELSYYDLESVAGDKARQAYYDAINRTQEMLDAEVANRRDSERDIRDGLSELANRVRILEERSST